MKRTRMRAHWRAYWNKWRGSTASAPPRVRGDEILWSWLGAAVAIGCLAWVGRTCFAAQDCPFLIGSFGASAVLVYGAPRSPLAQPRNLVGGHLVSALIGVLCWRLLHPWPALAQALAVSLAIALMHVTRTLHPPGGATALIATLGSPKIQALGFWYALMPATLGPLLLLLIGLVVNNLAKTRRYPEFWF